MRPAKTSKDGLTWLCRECSQTDHTDIGTQARNVLPVRRRATTKRQSHEHEETQDPRAPVIPSDHHPSHHRPSRSSNLVWRSASATSTTQQRMRDDETNIKILQTQRNEQLYGKPKWCARCSCVCRAPRCWRCLRSVSVCRSDPIASGSLDTTAHGSPLRVFLGREAERTVALRRLCACPFRASKMIQSEADRAECVVFAGGVCAPERARRLKSSFAPPFNLRCITRPRQSELFVRNSENALKQRAPRKTH